MKVLVDTDVLLDVALAREPHLDASKRLLQWASDNGDAAIVWHSLANCAYLLKDGGRAFLEKLLTFVEVVPTGTAEARRDLDLPMTDLEDALQAAAALAFEADCIVTRNVKDYRHSPVPALLPKAFLAKLD